MNHLRRLARKQLAMFEALRRLGFQSDDIFVAFYNDSLVKGRKVHEVFTELRVGGQTFKMNYPGEKKVERVVYIQTWTRAAEEWRDTMTNDERIAIYRAEFTEAHLLSLAQHIAAKGIKLPKLERADA